MRHKAYKGLEPNGVLREVAQVLHRVPAGDDVVSEEMVKASREHEQQAQRPDERAGDEPRERLVFLLHKRVYHIACAEEERIEHEVILRYEPCQQHKAGQDAVFRLELPHQADDQVHQHYREERQEHVHAYHHEGRHAYHAQPVEHSGGGAAAAAIAELPHGLIEHEHREHIQHVVERKPRPLGEGVREQGADGVQKPIVQRRVDVMHLIIIDGAKVEALPVRHGDVVKKLLPGEGLADHLPVLYVGQERGIVAVRQAVGIYLVNEHSGFAPGKQEAHSRDDHKNKHQRPTAAEFFFHLNSPEYIKYRLTV